MDDDQLQLDRHIAEFFQEAKSVSLTSIEREQARFAVETYLMEHSVSISPAMRLQEYMAHGHESSQFPQHFLGGKEKRELRKNLVSFMQQNPRLVREEIMESAPTSLSVFRMLEIAIPRFAFALVLFIGLGAGVSFASQSTIPGDFLYPFKVKVYEPIVSKLAVTEKSQAEWEARRLENRLKEAETLAASSRLTRENAAELRLQFTNHLHATQKNIDSLKAKGNEDDAISIQSGLEVYLGNHSSVMRAIALEEDNDASVGAAAAVTAKKPAPVIPVHAKKPSSSSEGFSLMETVQTILSLPAADSSSSKSSSKKQSSSSISSATQSSAPSSVASSKEKKSSSVSSAHSQVDTSVSSTQSSVPVMEDASSSSLVSAIFEDIMDAASSTISLPDLLPKL